MNVHVGGDTIYSMSAAQIGVPASARRTHAWPLVLAGAVTGLTWAAALRGWMTQMAGDASAFTWTGTFALLLAPGLLGGGLVGLAEHRRRTGGLRTRWLTLSPCLFLAALADPTILKLLITQGIGGGAIGVVAFGLAGGYALSARGRAWWRRTCGVFALLGVLLMTVLASDTAPLETAHGLWVGLYGASVLAVLMLACAIPQRIGRASLVPARWVATAAGAICGLAWASTLRAFMAEVAGDESRVQWAGTFIWIALPGTLIGALLAWSEHRRSTGSLPLPRWLVFSPMLFTATLLQDPLDLLHGFQGGIGLGALALPATGMLGGYAIAGHGAPWKRGLCGLLALSAIPLWALTATVVGGESMSLTEPHGLWAASLYWGLLATLCAAASIPHRLPNSDTEGSSAPQPGTVPRASSTFHSSTTEYRATGVSTRQDRTSRSGGPI